MGIFFCLPDTAPGVKNDDEAGPNIGGGGVGGMPDEGLGGGAGHPGVAGSLQGVISIPQKEACRTSALATSKWNAI